MLKSALPIPSVCRHSPLLVSQILTVLSPDADASRVESCEKTTDRTRPPWPSSICRYSPLLASQILTVLSSDADTSHVESCEKTADQAGPPWPLSACRQALHLSPIVGFIVIHFGSFSLKRPLVKLQAGLNI